MAYVSMNDVRKILCAEIIGESVHTALRKGCERGEDAHRAIREMPHEEWHRAMEWVAECLVEYIERDAITDAEDATCRTCDAECSGH